MSVAFILLLNFTGLIVHNVLIKTALYSSFPQAFLELESREISKSVIFKEIKWIWPNGIGEEIGNFRNFRGRNRKKLTY